MNALVLDYIVRILDWLGYQLDAYCFLRCHLSELEAYPQLRAVIEDMPEDWDARNRFLTRNNDIAIAALLWLAGKKPANKQAYDLWMELVSL